MPEVAGVGGSARFQFEQRRSKSGGEMCFEIGSAANSTLLPPGRPDLKGDGELAQGPGTKFSSLPKPGCADTHESRIRRTPLCGPQGAASPRGPALEGHEKELEEKRIGYFLRRWDVRGPPQR
jgi:hypothetical protein